MTSEKDNGRLSDTEGGEKPVREQLKKAHITSGPNAPKSDPAATATGSEHRDSNGGDATTNQERGRLHRKRSHEEVEGDSQDMTSEPPRQHTRKRSRDSTAEEDELNNGQRKVSGERVRNGDEAAATQESEANGTEKTARPSTPEATGEKRPEEAVESMTSPKSKRSRLHSTVAGDKDLAPPDEVAAEKTADSTKSKEEEKVSSEKESATKIPPTSGFANSSAASPFGALAGSKSPTSDQPQTSASAFAASGFSALAGSSSSGFGAIGKDSGGFGSGGSFATGAKSPLKAKENDKPSATSSSSFGGALGQQSAFATAASGSGSGFGSAASGFGKLGSSTTGGFGGGLGGTGFSSLSGGGLSSFASGKTVSPLGGTPKSAKPFGAPADEDDNEEEDEDKAGTKSPIATEEEKQDERFYEQELETGEEDESTEFSCRAKLYNFSADGDGKKEWRERGFGVIRLNVRRLQPDEEDQKPKARLLMRAEGSHRVVLNTPVKKEIAYGTPKGEKPQNGYFLFMGAIDGKEGLELLQLKMRQANALEMYEHICKLQAEM